MEHYFDSFRGGEFTSEAIKRHQEDWKRLFYEKGLVLSKDDKEEIDQDPQKYATGYFREVFLKFFKANHDIEIANSDHQNILELFRDCFPYLYTRYPNIDSFIDLGCGAGWPVALASMLGYRAIGIERNLEVLTIGKETFNELGIDNRRLIRGDYLQDAFWESIPCGVNPLAPTLFLLYQPKKQMDYGLPVVSKRMHKNSRIITGADFFSSDDTEAMDQELYEFNLQIETNLFRNCLILKKE